MSDVTTIPADDMRFHEAVTILASRSGDAQIIEMILRRKGWGAEPRNDAGERQPDIAARISGGVGVTDQDCYDTFGPQWREIVALVRRASRLTENEISSLLRNSVDTADAASTSVYAASDAAVFAQDPSATAWVSASHAAASHATAAAAAAAHAATSAAVHATSAVRRAAQAIATRHLIDTHGYTEAHYRTLTAQWQSVAGPLAKVG